jgi:hypothetical protein
MMTIFCNHKKNIFTILECAKINIIDLTKKNHGFISLALDRYLEDLNPFGSDRWSNSTIRLTQIRDGHTQIGKPKC